MSTKFPAVLAILMLASPAFAMTPKTAPVHGKASTSTSAATLAKKPALHARAHHYRMAKKTAMRGHSEVAALNALESNGYRQLTNLHAQGSDFVATAQKNGKSYAVTVTPSGAVQATQA